MSKAEKKANEPKEVAVVEGPPVDAQELLKRLSFKPGVLLWKNFNMEQPPLNAWVVIWCNLGPIAPNFFITFRDNLGNYDLPHPTKVYPVQAWALLGYPEADQESIKKAEADIRAEIEAKTKAAVQQNPA